MPNPQQRFLFIINPISGGKDKTDWETSIREYFRDIQCEFKIYTLKGENDKPAIQSQINTFHPDRVIAVGGDGTVKLLAEILMGSHMALGILPAGSANGMAKELDIPVEMDKSLDIIVNGKIKKIDLININEEVCMHLGDIGLNAMVVKNFERSDGRGMWGYFKALVGVLWNKRKMFASIETDSGDIQRNAYMIAIANARKYGTGANINPDGSIEDGQFEVVVVRRLSLKEIIKAIFTNRSFHPKKIEIHSTKSVKLLLRKQAHFQVDGEYRGKITRVEAQVLPSVINVMVPKNPKRA